MSEKCCLICEKGIKNRNYRSVFATPHLHEPISEVTGIRLLSEKIGLWRRNGWSTISCNLCTTKMNKLHKINIDLISGQQKLRKEKEQIISQFKKVRDRACTSVKSVEARKGGITRSVSSPSSKAPTKRILIQTLENTRKLVTIFPKRPDGENLAKQQSVDEQTQIESRPYPSVTVKINLTEKTGAGAATCNSSQPKDNGLKERSCDDSVNPSVFSVQEKVYMDDQHGSDVMKELSQLWQDEQLCDALISNGTTTIKAHKVVLLAACPVLRPFDKDVSGETPLHVNVPSDIERDIIDAFLVYIYDGVLRLTVDTVPQMIRLAKMMKEDTVMGYCEDFQTSNVTVKQEPMDFMESDVSPPTDHDASDRLLSETSTRLLGTHHHGADNQSCTPPSNPVMLVQNTANIQSSSSKSRPRPIAPCSLPSLDSYRPGLHSSNADNIPPASLKVINCSQKEPSSASGQATHDIKIEPNTCAQQTYYSQVPLNDSDTANSKPTCGLVPVNETNPPPDKDTTESELLPNKNMTQVQKISTLTSPRPDLAATTQTVTEPIQALIQHVQSFQTVPTQTMTHPRPIAPRSLTSLDSCRPGLHSSNADNIPPALTSPRQVLAATTPTVTEPIQALIHHVQSLPTVATQTMTSQRLVNLAAPMQTLTLPMQNVSALTQCLTAPMQMSTAPTQTMISLRPALAAPTQTLTSPLQTLPSPIQVFTAPVCGLATPMQFLGAPMQNLAIPTRVLTTQLQTPTASMQTLRALTQTSTAPLPTQIWCSAHAQRQIWTSTSPLVNADSVPSVKRESLSTAPGGKRVSHIQHVMRKKIKKEEEAAPSSLDLENWREAVNLLSKGFYFGQRHRNKYHYKCEKCSLELFTEPHAVQHMQTVHQVDRKDAIDCVVAEKKSDPSIIECRICDYRPGNRDYVQFHRYFKHQIPLPTSCKVKRCDVCHKEFFSKFALKEHMNTHKEHASYVCEFCGMGFAKHDQQRSHVYNCHNDEKRFVCKMCKKRFKKRKQIETHLRIHTGVRPFKCPDCSYEGTTKHNLKVHMWKEHKTSIDKADLPAVQDVTLLQNSVAPMEDMIEVLPSSKGATCN